MIHFKTFDDFLSNYNPQSSAIYFKGCKVGDVSKLKDAEDVFDLNFEDCTNIPLDHIQDFNKVWALRINNSSVNGEWESLVESEIKDLVLEDMTLKNYCFLSNMNELNNLFLTNTNFNNLENLPKNITALGLNGSQISFSDINFKLLNLDYLKLQNVQCESLDFLYNMPNISTLFLKGINKNIDLTPVKSLQLEFYESPSGETQLFS